MPIETNLRPAARLASTFIRPNRYAANCATCTAHIPAGDGNLTREDGRWVTRCVEPCEAPAAPVAAPAPAAPDAGVGYYLVGDNVYRVVKAKTSDRRYAKVLVLPAQRGHGVQATWEYAPGVVGTLSADAVLSAGDAARLGHLHGYCVFCGKPLSDVKSEAAGYGSTCAKREGLPYPTLAEARAVIASRVESRGTRD